MKFKLLLLIFFLIHGKSVLGQIPISSGIFFAKEYSKEIALYKAKTFVMYEILGISENVVKFEIEPLAASTSGELTSIVYSCSEKNIEGLVLGFYGDRWNENGVIFQSYAFKNFTKNEAIEMLNKVENVFNENSEYLNKDIDNNNVYYKYGDCTFLIYISQGIPHIRVFWNGFDANWESTAFKRTKKRLLKKLD